MNISFSATTDQVRHHRKHCTRRIDKSLRLAKLRPGDILQGIEKGQGIPKGSHVAKLDQIVETFCKINPKCTPDTEITRVLFDYMDGAK